MTRSKMCSFVSIQKWTLFWLSAYNICFGQHVDYSTLLNIYLYCMAYKQPIHLWNCRNVSLFSCRGWCSRLRWENRFAYIASSRFLWTIAILSCQIFRHWLETVNFYFTIFSYMRREVFLLALCVNNQSFPALSTQIIITATSYGEQCFANQNRFHKFFKFLLWCLMSSME